MCVIFIVDNDQKRPNDTMIERAWDKNDDGGGFAYRDKGEVVWEKGIEDVEYMKKMAAELPVPYVLHFRIASMNGGGIRPQLTHPFPIDTKTSLALKGRTNGYVLFHNGDWKGWDDAARYAAITRGATIPAGKWSDSRAMAWLCAIYGHGFMELLPTQKGVAFGPKDIDVFTGPGFVKVNDIWCSNDYFVSYSNPTKASTNAIEIKMCSWGNCTEKEGIDKDSRCRQHPKTIYPTHNSGPIATKAGWKADAEVSRAAAGSGPFQQGQPNNQRPLITVEEAEIMEKNGKMSKGLLKAIKKAYDQLGSTDQKSKERAEHGLKMATVIVSRVVGASAPPSQRA